MSSVPPRYPHHHPAPVLLARLRRGPSARPLRSPRRGGAGRCAAGGGKTLGGGGGWGGCGSAPAAHHPGTPRGFGSLPGFSETSRLCAGKTPPPSPLRLGSARPEAAGTRLPRVPCPLLGLQDTRAARVFNALKVPLRTSRPSPSPRGDPAAAAARPVGRDGERRAGGAPPWGSAARGTPARVGSPPAACQAALYRERLAPRVCADMRVTGCPYSSDLIWINEVHRDLRET